MTRPQLDHVVPLRGSPMLLAVVDREENRRRRDWQPQPTIRPKTKKKRQTRRERSAAVTKERALDQFYTRDDVAAGYLDELRTRYDLPLWLLVEPSAGGGAFYRRMPEYSVAFDKDPHGSGILKADYFTIELRCARRIMTVGNPPFGNVACLAVEFFNHAALQSDVIAMILPRSFLKASIENRLNRAFHRVHCDDVPPNAFSLAGEPRDVASVFQIWERRSTERELRPQDTSHPDFGFCTQAEADFAIRRVGAYAGRITPGHELKESNVHDDSYHFIKGDVERIMAQLDLVGAARTATSTPSLAKSEIVELYREWLAGHAKPQRDDQR